MNDIPFLRKKMKNKLDPMRYEHTLSVSFTCMSLAMRYGYDLDKAELAGLLHDCAKRYDDATIIEKCQKAGLDLTDDELQAPAVLHAKYGAWMAEHKYDITDEDVLSAIRCHTTGKPQMTLLDQILYVADYIEPRRYKAANLDAMRSLAYINLEDALFEIMKSTLEYLNDKGCYVDSMTQKAYDYYISVRTKNNDSSNSGMYNAGQEESEEDHESVKRNDKNSRSRT